MNKTFSRIFNGGKAIGKYLVFSCAFLFAFLVNAGEVGASNTDFPYKVDTNTSVKDSIVHNDTDACNATGLPDNYLSYTLNSSNYRTNGTSASTPCVSYRFEDSSGKHRLFYLQGNDGPILGTPAPTETNLQTIKFTISTTEFANFDKITDIAIYEQEYAKNDKLSYDLYSKNSEGNFVYKHVFTVPHATFTNDTYYASTGIDKGNFTKSGSTLTFVYALRNPEYGLNTVYINFYTGEPNDNNVTERTQIDFYFAKPISDFESQLVELNTRESAPVPTGEGQCKLDVSADAKICFVYKNNTADSGTGTRKIYVYFPKNAAFYFSTVNDHSTEWEAATTATTKKDAILKYNSIYAYNDFKNIDNSTVQYLYYNFTDLTSYDTTDANGKINVSGDYYYMYLTVDARGTYTFSIRDIFNILETPDTKVTVQDVENRNLDIYFLRNQDSSGAEDVSKNNQAYAATGSAPALEKADFFQIGEHDLTNQNIKLVLEYYYTVQIGSDYAVNTSGTIIANPLGTDDNGRLQVSTSTYCKLYVSGEDASRTMECLGDSNPTSFQEHNFNSNQEIDATYAGLNNLKDDPDTDYSYGDITNEFTLVRGTVNITGVARYHDDILNKMAIWVNENGSFKVYIKDAFGNDTSAWIDVSSIDQYQPTIAFGPSITGATDITDDDISSISFPSAGSTTLCESNYVYGGNSAYAAKIYGETGYNANCTAQSVTYDVTAAKDFSSATTGKQTDSDRFLLNENGTTELQMVYYKTNGARSFNYADAIRIARLTAVDSITSLAASNATSKTITVRSRYTVDDSPTYSAYKIVNATEATNAQIILGNYLQYSSNLDTFEEDRLQIKILVNGAAIDFGSGDTVCNSTANKTNCYDYVNNFIDRNINFQIEFNAKDVVGNVSDTYTLSVTVLDDTTPGIRAIDNETGEDVAEMPNIHMINIDTICRLEVGNNIQAKDNLLACYGLTRENGSIYNFVDNDSGYISASDNTRIGYTHTNFGNVLSHQWYRKMSNYDSKIKVEINIGTPSSANWKVVGNTQSSNQQMADAGYYQLKFTIDDQRSNVTVLIVWYYVNPKVLLIAPTEADYDYGTEQETLGYDIYISGNDEAFHMNVFELTGKDAITFLANYQKADTSNNNFLILGNREMAGELKLVYKGDHDAAARRSPANGDLSYTTKENSINSDAVKNVGAYYITMGDLRVINNAAGDARDTDNYVIRLHPAYLINGQTPKTALESYDSNNVKENVSNALMVVKQTILNVEATGGEKMYGVVDTNYKYYGTTDRTAGVTGSNVNSNSALAYLNGYSVTGFKYTDAVTTEYSATTANGFEYTKGGFIIDGVLRRVAGEKVGTYAICNDNARSSGSLRSPTGISDLGCDSSATNGTWVLKPAKTIQVTTNNVYYAANSTSAVTGLTNDKLTLTELLGFYISDGTNYYRLTEENFDADTKVLSVIDEIWKYTYDIGAGAKVYDDEYRADDALQVAPNPITGNRNYVIQFTTGTYTIKTRNLIIQPGINQGKEYSTPNHVDPWWQIVIYGEVEGTITPASSGFNGYTVDEGHNDYSSQAATKNNYDYNGGKESDIYFARRKKSPDATYLYEYTITATSGVFTLDGVSYKVASATSICRNTGRSGETECYTADNGVFTIGGINKVTVNGNTITVVIQGNLEYQNYTLFKSGTGAAAGSGYIGRTSGEIVGWYGFTHDLSNLAPMPHNALGTGANYGMLWNDNAPKVDKDTTTTPPTIVDYRTYGGDPTDAATYNSATGNGSGQTYTPDGNNACTDGFYSVDCSGSNLKSGNATKILFEIFKRDIIVSFNYRTDNYGFAYADYKNWYFDYTSTSSATPKNAKNPSDMITCYIKSGEGTYSGTEYEVNGVKYVKVSSCQGEEIGLASSDKWNGEGGLKLEFYLALAETASGISNFVTNDKGVYALPAGKHYVSARIDNDNYRLIYVDYYAVKAAGDTSENGLIDIKSSEVTITATSYQKEYGQAQYAKYLNADGTTWETPIITIFDLNYVSCLQTSGPAHLGCGYTSLSNHSNDSATTVDALGALATKNLYSSKSNIYAYTVAPNTGFIVAGTRTGAPETVSVITDTVYNSFYGLPVRTRYSKTHASDKYGLLDGAGRYEISVSGINASYAYYTSNDETLLGIGIPAVGETAPISTDTANKLMIQRYTSYEIKTRTSGTLYILPAQIEIEVSNTSQTKVYGCAYNGSIGTASWTLNPNDLTSTYANCIENIGKYYDFGYSYDVYGDKTFFLLTSSAAKLSGYNSYSVANTIKAYGTVDDVVYATSVAYSVNGIGSSHTIGDYENNTIVNKSYTSETATTDITISNSALNDGVLYRHNAGATDNKYSYAAFWEYANDALTITSGEYQGFQNQGGGNYVLTLGNLDAEFNKNKHCNDVNAPTSSGTNYCKNFIVKKGSNNTANHIKNASGVESISTDVDHVFAAVEFTITQRTVALHTEYNYKVYGDTDSLEGFTYAEIASMYDRTGGSAYSKAKAFSFKSRKVNGVDANSITNDSASFVNMGTSRFYAVDATLAKAPWTKWSDNRQEDDKGSDFYYYDDILWDVIDGLLARTNEVASKSTEYNKIGINDKVGIYKYDWSNIDITDSVDRDTSNGYHDEYTKLILKGTSNYPSGTPTNASTDGKYDIGFFAGTSPNLQRWYTDARHEELLPTETRDSEVYHKFTIKDFEKATGGDGNYPFATTKSFGDVYYEVVKRQIYVVVDDVQKDYGIEDTYALFTVKLCSVYDDDTGECKLIHSDNAYGERTALAKYDFAEFITATGKEDKYATGITYDQEKIKGYDSNTGYARFVGTATRNESDSARGSFGIHYFRNIGEKVGTYPVHACPNQTGTINACTSIPSGGSKTYEAGTDGTAYNAANYIIISITGSLTVNKREIDITPNDNQGFQYGNYEAGQKIAPITYYENYDEAAATNGNIGFSSGSTVGGLVNGAIGVTSAGVAIGATDTLAAQYALCLFDISRIHEVCINDRQNSTLNKTTTLKAYTKQYTLGNANTDASPGENNIKSIPNSGLTSQLYYNNVYNDDYTADNDDTRMALDRREKETNGGDRYSRNVGVYLITAGEILTTATACTSDTVSDTSGANKNCISPNYKIGTFTEGKEYTITPADITLEVVSDQSKIYGQKDVELKFKLKTSFTLDELPVDYYYCGDEQSDCAQSFAKDEEKSGNTITLTGFAYGEDGSGYTNTHAEEGHNYGMAKGHNKSSEQKNSQTNVSDMKYFDKYCLTGTSGNYTTEFSEFACTGTYTDSGKTTTHVKLAYTATSSRILLGYLYVSGWAQTQGTHMIKNGIIVADNEYGHKNYVFKLSANEDAIGENTMTNTPDASLDLDTNVNFTIHKLELQLSIQNIEKTYGEATDKYKCENGNCNIRNNSVSGYNINNRLLRAKNNEDRLEFNFDVVNYTNSNNVHDGAGLPETGVEGGDDEIRLTKTINNHYYTQTAAAETKNVHLGLTVIRAKEAADTSVLCSIDSDEFGCEDATIYTDLDGSSVTTHYNLKFLHSVVADSVDANYSLFIGSNAVELEDTDSNYVAVTRASGTATKDTAKANFDATDKYLKNSDIATLKINRRNITFYIGTYTNNDLVDEKYTIEQNEALPLLPLIKNASNPVYNGEMAKDETTDPKEKEVYFVTWFDNIDPTTVYARQVRTADKINTSRTSTTPGYSEVYGIAYCKISLNSFSPAKTSVNDVNTGNCNGANLFYADQTNDQNPDGSYKFNTSLVGTYAIIRDKSVTGVFSGDYDASADNKGYNTNYDNQKYENKNYLTTDINGVLVIIEDSTAPIIELPRGEYNSSTGKYAWEMEYTIEANADEVVCDGGDCVVVGKQVGVADTQTSIDTLGQAIKYLTKHFSGFVTDSSEYGFTQGKNLVGLSTAAGGLNLSGSLASDNVNWGGYCKTITDTGCNELFFKVNNPDLVFKDENGDGKNDTGAATTFGTTRAANTYDWDTDYLEDDELEKMVTTIISWYNITSYDYGYIRNDQYVTKRYTPRYYIYINGTNDDPQTLAAFDPRYVGDFTISVYAVDDIGNVSAPVEVVLHVKDETKPVTGEMYLFNAPVSCDAATLGTKECATTITDWYVDVSQDRLININSFVKYTKDGTLYKRDDINGTYIKVGKNDTDYKSLYAAPASGGIQRYDYNATVASATPNVNGMYIKATSGMQIPALEVEHRYWSKEDTIYLVALGGSDNSYINGTANAQGKFVSLDDAQWFNYYRVNGNWYKYIRSDTDGVAITTAEGINDIAISAVDSGRKVNTTSVSHVYYDAIYLIHGDSYDSSLCTKLGCKDANIQASINKQATVINQETKKFNILGTEFELKEFDNGVPTKVGWGSGHTGDILQTDDTPSQSYFSAGIVVCYFNSDFTKVEKCLTNYVGVYEESDKKTIATLANYNSPENVGASVNVSEWSTAADDKYYTDRKYVYIDKTAPTITLTDDRYRVFEFGCASGVTSDNACSGTYPEEYHVSVDNSTTKGNLSTGGTALTNAAGDLFTELSALNGASNYTSVRGYTGTTTTPTASVSSVDIAADAANTDLDSGLATFTSAPAYDNPMGGTSSPVYGTNFVNYFYTNISVYLATKAVNASGTATWSYYKYTITWTGTRFEVYRSTKANESAAHTIIDGFANGNKITDSVYGSANADLSATATIEDLLERIVYSENNKTNIKAALPSGSTAFEYHFDINYDIYDIAGNISNRLVRGITFVKLNSKIKVTITEPAAANAGVSALVDQGDNTYTVTVNQGASFASILKGFTISNVNNTGVNNLSTIKQSLYYNGEVLFENLPYNSDILSIIDSYNNAPGTYTLKLTSTRQAGTLGTLYEVEDTPLTINFVVDLANASVEEISDYSHLIAPIMVMAIASLFLLGLGYVSMKKKRND